MNFLNPEGLPLIKEEKKLFWADSIRIKGEIQKNWIDSINLKAAFPENIVNNKQSSMKEEKGLKSEKEGNPEKNRAELKKEPSAIQLEQAFKLFNQKAIFLDARETEDFMEGHIKGALSLPYYQFDSHKNILNNISKNNIIVTYCAGTDCDLSIFLGKQLFDMGYLKTYIFFGGWNDWLNAKYPVERNENL